MAPSFIKDGGEMILIAENTSTKYAVYMTDEDGQLMFSVCKGDKIGGI